MNLADYPQFRDIAWMFQYHAPEPSLCDNCVHAGNIPGGFHNPLSEGRASKGQSITPYG
jgi:hypothetical protein